MERVVMVGLPGVRGPVSTTWAETKILLQCQRFIALDRGGIAFRILLELRGTQIVSAQVVLVSFQRAISIALKKPRKRAAVPMPGARAACGSGSSSRRGGACLSPLSGQLWQKRACARGLPKIPR